MFIYIVERDVRGLAKYIDKYICKDKCTHCSLRFICFTKEWKTLRSQDDYGALYERSEIVHIPLNLAYCCRLVVGKVWDELENDYVPEI